MKSGEYSYAAGEWIYHEGDPNDCVYVVLFGAVELSKAGPDGQMLIGTVASLEIFGEMGILDGAPRSSDALAIEPTVIKAIPRQEFLQWVRSDPQAASQLMGGLPERLLAADLGSANRDGSVSVLGGLLGLVKDWFRKPKGPPVYNAATAPLMMPGLPPTPPWKIGITTLNNDTDGAWSRHLLGLLEGQDGLVFSLLPHGLTLPPQPDQAQAMSVLLRANQLLMRTSDLSLLLWGDVHEHGFTLHLTATADIADDCPTGFTPYLTLELPAESDPPFVKLLTLAVLAAIEPQSEGHKMLQRQLLPQAMTALDGFLTELPVAWSLEQQRTALMVYGHAAMILASWEGDVAWYDHAAQAYKAAQNRLVPESWDFDRAMTERAIGQALLGSGERNASADQIREAIDFFRKAGDNLVKASHPLEWAGLRHRLGTALYKLDQQLDETDLLRQALLTLQDALQLLSRKDQPQRWADVMVSLTLVLQVYGDRIRNPQLLERAIAACKATMDVRTRDRHPLGWANLQNTLGTALFLLDKHTDRTLHLSDAAQAFMAADEMYQALGATRLAQVAQRNLRRVQRIPLALPAPEDSKAVFLDWAEAPEPAKLPDPTPARPPPKLIAER